MQKYPFLRYATLVLRILGWVVLVAGVIASIVLGIAIPSTLPSAFGKFGVGVGILITVGGIISSFLAWLFLLATRELICILIQVEENTRNTAERITKESG